MKESSLPILFVRRLLQKVFRADNIGCVQEIVRKVRRSRFGRVDASIMELEYDDFRVDRGSARTVPDTRRKPTDGVAAITEVDSPDLISVDESSDFSCKQLQKLIRLI